MDAARFWAGRPASQETVDARGEQPTEWQAAIDVHESNKNQTIGENHAEDFGVFKENWQTLLVFLALSHCWRIDGMAGVYLGLDRPSIESTLKMMHIRPAKHPEILQKLMVMENAALEVINRNAKGSGQ